MRTYSVYTVNQFASCFDRSMRKLHPDQAWETASNNKWRKNFSGATLTKKSLGWLSELFPDATNLFNEGPGKVWLALWKPAIEPSDLWQIYDACDIPWGTANVYHAAVEELSIKVFGEYESYCRTRNLGRSIVRTRNQYASDDEDFGRAIVLYRLNDEFDIGRNEDRMNAYLCAKALLSIIGSGFAFNYVMHDIADFIANIEQEKLDADWAYWDVVKECWGRREQFETSDMLEYVHNPFFRMAESIGHSDCDYLARHYWLIASDTDDGYRRSKDNAQTLIRAY